MPNGIRLFGVSLISFKMGSIQQDETPLHDDGELRCGSAIGLYPWVCGGGLPVDGIDWTARRRDCLLDACIPVADCVRCATAAIDAFLYGPTLTVCVCVLERRLDGYRTSLMMMGCSGLPCCLDR